MNVSASLTSEGLKLRTPDNLELSIPRETLNLSKKEEELLSKLVKTPGLFAKLGEEDKKLLKNKRALMHPIGPDALIVRFDWKWVRIDE